MYGAGFLDPKGGDPRGSWFWSGPGIATDLGLMGAAWLHGFSMKDKRIGAASEFFAPYRVKTRKGHGVGSAKWHEKHPTSDITRADSIQHKARAHYRSHKAHLRTLVGPAAPGYVERMQRFKRTASRHTLMANELGARRNVEEVLRGRPALGRGAHSVAVKDARAYMGMGRFFKGMGLLFLMEGMFELGVGLGTPGVAKTAAARDAALFADERALDSSAAFTQRQRAIQAIHDSQMSVRAVIGQESRYMHR